MNKRGKSVYQKIMNRSDSLLDCQYWYRGETFALKERSHGLVFFKPLFVYEKGKGVGIYYDYSDPEQSPDAVIEYFNNHIDEFKALMGEYRDRDSKLLTLAKKEDPKDLEFVFEEMVALWPMRVLVNIFPKMEDRGVTKELAEIAFTHRSETDATPYVVGPSLYEMSVKRVLKDRVGDVEFFTFEEIQSGNFPNAEECMKRKKGYIYFDDSVTHSVSLDEYAAEKGIVIDVDDIDLESRVIKGTSAHKGNVTGTVRVLLERAQINTVKDGEIIVAPMTTPDFLPAMKHAAAFVTDEGGITSHAAIVARELGKPCIIGTKIATQILKDGMKVEVDADAGVVKILEKDE